MSDSSSPSVPNSDKSGIRCSGCPKPMFVDCSISSCLLCPNYLHTGSFRLCKTCSIEEKRCYICLKEVK